MSDLKTQMLNLTLNICMDLTCKRRLFNTPEESIKTSHKKNSK